jgi:hypothetical protein
MNGIRQGTVRAAVSWIVLVSHLTAIFSAPFLIIDFSDAMDVILILCPLTGAFVLIVVQHYAQAFEISTDRPVLLDVNAALMTIFLCVVLAVAIVGVQYLYWMGRIPDIEMLKRAVGVVDTVIGGYTAILIKSLFGAVVVSTRQPVDFRPTSIERGHLDTDQ